MHWRSIVFSLATLGVLTIRPALAQQGACDEIAHGNALTRHRHSPDPGKRRPGDASQGAEKAVLDGLRWLIRHQNPDGSWGADTLKDRCDAVAPCFDPKDRLTGKANVGLTGLALLCFLGAGFGPDSRQDIVDTTKAKRSNIGQVVAAGLQWLSQQQPKDGWFASHEWSFDQHAIVTTALCEAYGMTGDPARLRAAKRAVSALIRAQAPSPIGPGAKWGWAPNPSYLFKEASEGGDEDATKRLYSADMISTSWAMSALNSARLAGLTVDSDSVAGGLEFTRFATADNGLVGYDDAKYAGMTLQGKRDHFIFHPFVFSAQGMWVRMLALHDPNDAFLDVAAKCVVSDLPVVSKDKLSIDYTYWYWTTLALWNLDGPDSPRKSGKYWNAWNKAVIDAVLSLQDHTERMCSNGGWIVPDRWAYVGGPLYTTALSVLTLETYWRYPNVLKTARVDESSAEYLSGWTDDEFQTAAKTVREAAARRDGDLAAAFDDALAYYREVAVADEKTPDAAARRARKELADFSAREVMLLVEGLVRQQPEHSLTWMLARASAPKAEKSCSKWMLDQIQVAARSGGNARLGTGPERARRLSMLRCDAETALVYARHGTLGSLRDLWMSPVAALVPLADSLADFQADFDVRLKEAKNQEILRATGKMTRAEGGAKARLDELVQPRTTKEWWRSARGLHEKRLEIDAAGIEERKLLGLERSTPAAESKPDPTCPADLPALRAQATILGGEPFVERSLLGRFLAAHREIALVPLPDCRMALLDTGAQEAGIVLAAATVLDPYLKILPR